MSLGRWIATGWVVLAMSGGVALAAGEECTQALLEEKQTALGIYMEQNPDKGARIEEAVATVEATYGGEPPPEMRCQAMDELLEVIKKF